MAKVKDDTLRAHAEAQATASYRAALDGLPAVPIELVPDHYPEPDVRRYWAVQLKPGEYRAAIVYAYPGRGGALFVGTDGSRADVVHWLATHGIPAVRLGKVTGNRN